MDHEHWFDRLHRSVTQAASRRGILGAALTLGVALVGGDVSLTESAKNNRNKRKNQKKKNKKRKNQRPKSPPPPCSGGACAAEPAWAGNQAEIDYCEFICEQCNAGDPREFCIGHFPNGPVAYCCSVGSSCCDLGAGRGGLCLGKDACCPDDFESGWCDPAGYICCPGYGCVPRVDGCPGEQCREFCESFGPGYMCCNGNCLLVENDDLNCGGCGRRCEGEGERCCDSVCVDARIDPNNCGQCGNSQPGQICCNRRLWPADQYHCCQHATGYYPCANGYDCCIANGGPYCCRP